MQVDSQSGALVSNEYGACCGTKRLCLNTGVVMTALYKHEELRVSHLAGKLGPYRTGSSSDANTPPH